MAKVARKLKSMTKAAGFAEEAQPFLHEDIVRGVPAKRVQGLIDKVSSTGRKSFASSRSVPSIDVLANGEALKIGEADVISRLLRITETANQGVRRRGIRAQIAQPSRSRPERSRFRTNWQKPTLARAKLR